MDSLEVRKKAIDFTKWVLRNRKTLDWGNTWGRIYEQFEKEKTGAPQPARPQ